MRNTKLFLTLSFSIFSMFFGAGNIIFPLSIGFGLGENFIYGFIGLVITAVVLPLLGLLVMLRYEGDYPRFFEKIGKVPGFCLIALMLALLGPFGAIPRCLMISHSTIASSVYCPSFLQHFDLFNLLSCGLIFLLSFKLERVLNVLGYILTPVLLSFLGVILIKGLCVSSTPTLVKHSCFEALSQGLLEGYQTMDLLAAFFFSSCVLLCLKKQKITYDLSTKFFKSPVVYAGILASLILGVVYYGFGKLAAHHQQLLSHVSFHQMLGALTTHLLGDFGGIVAAIIMALACLTTQIALAIIASEFLFEKVFKQRISYAGCLIAVLGTSFFIAKMEYHNIASLLASILQLLYPSLIFLIGLNFLSKQYAFKQVKLWFYSSMVGFGIIYGAVIFFR